ncbi:MAG: HAD family hydrolase [Azospirillaceae bacterium]|nr:HAD family hydrolase [Azospirillaceae bacterium]
MTVPRALPRAILFDWDNTLADNWRCVVAAFNAALADAGLPTWTEAEVRIRARKSLRDSFPGLFGDRWEHARDIFYAAFARDHIEHLRPMPGAAAALAACAAQNLYLAIVSNKSGEFLRQEVAALGWSGHFSRVIGAGDAARDKPARDAVDLALESSGVTAGEQVWFVGDADIDMHCAHATGCVPVLIGIADDSFRTAPPLHCFDSCAAFGDLVSRLAIPIS